MHKTFWLLFFCLVTAGAKAQEAASLRITVTNPRQEPVAGATVELRKLPDSALVKVQMTDATGTLVFENLVKERTYFCRVSSTGFALFTSPALSPANEKATAFVLEPASGAMTGITVTARKPFIELKPGKTVVNVEAGITNAGVTAMEALEKMPGITVDKDGNLSLKGKSGVLVMIDGKQTYLDPSQLATMLNGMSATQIELVEIMNQPPAGYDAAGNAGVINIKLKKSRQRGFNGAVTLGYAQGAYPKTNNNLQLAYRTDKWNVFGNYTVNINRSFSRIYALRTYFNPNGSVASLLEQPSYFKGTGNTHNLRAGADYSLSAKTTLGFTLTGLSLERGSNITNEALWMNPQKQRDSLIRTSGENTTGWKNAGGNLNFKHSFSATRELTADVDLIGYRMRGDQLFENRLLAPGGYVEATRADLPSDIRILSAKTDYSSQWKGVRLQTGLKASHITTDNLAHYEINEGGVWTQDDGKSNHFLYTERIQAAYANAETNTGRWSLQGGLRFEATSYDARQLGNSRQKDSSFSRSYNSLFPTVLTTFEADSNHSISLAAGRRIDRPGFQKLNPFVFIINKYTYQQGNPYYRPQYTWNTEISHVYKNKFITSFGYSVTTDYFSQIFPVSSNGLVIYTEGNLGKLQQYTLSVSAQVSPAPWWSFSAQATGVHKEMEGVIDRQLKASINQFQLNMNHQLKFKKGWSGEISGFYTSRSQADIQEIVDPAGQLSLGIAKTVWQNRGTIKLGVRDIFYTQWMKGNTYFPNATEYFKLTRDTRVAQVSFSYRFGKTFKANKRSEGAAGDEIRRVGNG
ncbi:TonB-dependent receptor [Flavisolibacter sp. BT320]|nr:TonB-dependent receptor [Flavisolibacter longurius]